MKLEWIILAVLAAAVVVGFRAVARSCAARLPLAVIVAAAVVGVLLGALSVELYYARNDSSFEPILLPSSFVIEDQVAPLPGR